MTNRALLDTNIVLDWLHFREPQVDAIRDDIAAGRLVALSHALTLDELARVLEYSGLALDDAKRGEILGSYVAQTTPLGLAVGVTRDRFDLPNGFPVCRDPADQFLLALAYHGKADFLITHDKQVLKLAKRARRFGLRIIKARDYNAV